MMATRASCRMAMRRNLRGYTIVLPSAASHGAYSCHGCEIVEQASSSGANRLGGCGHQRCRPTGGAFLGSSWPRRAPAVARGGYGAARTRPKTSGGGGASDRGGSRPLLAARPVRRCDRAARSGNRGPRAERSEARRGALAVRSRLREPVEGSRYRQLR
jgi:hypothetical protein